MNADAYIDATGWLCPKPVIEARLYMQHLKPGETLQITLTDPHGPLDFEVFTQRNGHRLLECRQAVSGLSEVSVWQILLEKGAV